MPLLRPEGPGPDRAAHGTGAIDGTSTLTLFRRRTSSGFVSVFSGFDERAEPRDCL